MRIGFLLLWILCLPTASMAGAHFLEFSVGGSKVKREWRKPVSIRWRYATDSAPSGAREIIEASLNTWKNTTSTDLTIEYAGTIATCDPEDDGYSDFCFNYDFSNLGLADSGILALTLRNGVVDDVIRNGDDRYLEDSDVLVNPEYAPWVTDEGLVTSAEVMDLQEILTHEIGHLLGLAHSFSIDAIMYPAKPTADTPDDLVALVRYPKRSLSQDDKGWIGSLYPDSSFQSSTAKISGRVFYNNRAYVGALVTAVKADASDVSLNAPASYPQDLILKGMSNVSAFSEQDGRFEIKGLQPGPYVLFVQDGEDFLNFSLANVSEFLALMYTASYMPVSIPTSPDCPTTSLALAPSTWSAAYASAERYVLAAGQSLCNVEIVAKSGTGSCKGEPHVAGSCGGGGCQLDASSEEDRVPVPFMKKSWWDQFFQDYKGVFLMTFGVLIILWSLNQQLKANTKPPRRPKK